MGATYDAMGTGQKGVEMGFEIIPLKNVSAAFKYFIGKDQVFDTNILREDDASKFFTELNFFF